jgi:transposase
MRFVPIKSVEQQAQLAVHHGRQLLKQERTAQINQIRAVLTEFGLVVLTNPDNLRAQLHDLIEDASSKMRRRARHKRYTASVRSRHRPLSRPWLTLSNLKMVLSLGHG